jgi:hypothetical protein
MLVFPPIPVPVVSLFRHIHLGPPDSPPYSLSIVNQSMWFTQGGDQDASKHRALPDARLVGSFTHRLWT